jgi:hypothetical protein
MNLFRAGVAGRKVLKPAYPTLTKVHQFSPCRLPRGSISLDR